ncbi:MAG: alkaline phosphatase family protein [Janthinobacterium lividum]
MRAVEPPRDVAATAPARGPLYPASPARLTVVISVDQFSADLFAEHRNHYTGGLARLLTGAVFPSGYQSHAATETCPGHSTILTGMRPEHTGIVANTWVDQSAPRADKLVYCAEDESAPGSDHEHYTVSDRHLKVPTLGEMMKAANPASRVVSVAGKDRAAVMMGGHKVDELWWWDGHAFVTYAGRATPAVVTRANAATGALLAAPQAPLPLPGFCRASDLTVAVAGHDYGQGRFARTGGDTKAFRASPAADASVFALAAGLIQAQGLGKDAAPDLVAIGASATDYVGHTYGNQGTEMCIQVAQLDQAIGQFMDELDAEGLDYQVVLTADHGAHDFTERQRERAMPMETRLSADLRAKAIGKAIAAEQHLTGPVLLSAEEDVFVDTALPPATRARVLAEARRRYSESPQIAAAFTRAEVAATPSPSGPPETWTLLQRARASFDPQRSGDLVILTAARVNPISDPAGGYIETHGSPWDYDRRVPILFWRRGMTGFEQPLSVETVDIAPTLAALLRVPVHGLDGRCLDLDPGPARTCPN